MRRRPLAVRSDRRGERGVLTDEADVPIQVGPYMLFASAIPTIDRIE
jgi:hypothetical protein